MGRLLPGDFEGLLMSKPGSSQLGTHVAKRCIDFIEVDRVTVRESGSGHEILMQCGLPDLSVAS